MSKKPTNLKLLKKVLKKVVPPKLSAAEIAKKQAALIAGPFSDYRILNVKGEVVEFGFAQVKKLNSRKLPDGYKLSLIKGD